MADRNLFGFVLNATQTRKGTIKTAVAVCRGTLAEGDTVEVRRPGGKAWRAEVRGVGRRPVGPEHDVAHVRIDDLASDQVQRGDLVSLPGAHELCVPPGSDIARLAEQIGRQRERGFESTVLGNHPSLYSDLELATLVDKQVRDAVRHAHGPQGLRGYLSEPAATLKALGLREQADRLMLLVSAMLEGRPYEVGAALMLGHRAMWDEAEERAGAEGSRLVADVEAALAHDGHSHDCLLEPMSGMAMLSEVLAKHNRSFACGDGNGLRILGEGIREPLQREGRAVAVGWCKRCGVPRKLDGRMRCAACGRKPTDFRVVVPGDVVLAEDALARKFGVRAPDGASGAGTRRARA